MVMLSEWHMHDWHMYDCVLSSFMTWSCNENVICMIAICMLVYLVFVSHGHVKRMSYA